MLQQALTHVIANEGVYTADDEAFTAALGTDLAGFESAWLADLGAEHPTRHGPQPAPAGPLPPGWEADVSADPVPVDPAPADPAGADVAAQTDWRVLAMVALAGLVVGGGIAYGRRRRARSRNGGATA